MKTLAYYTIQTYNLIDNDYHYYQERGVSFFMSTKLRQAIESRKTHIIEKLLDLGIYKKAGCQLYELCLSDLEKEYSDLVKHKLKNDKGA